MAPRGPGSPIEGPSSGEEGPSIFSKTHQAPLGQYARPRDYTSSADRSDIRPGYRACGLPARSPGRLGMNRARHALAPFLPGPLCVGRSAAPSSRAPAQRKV